MLNELKQALLNGKRVEAKDFPIISAGLDKFPKGYMFQYNVGLSWLLHSAYYYTEFNGELLLFKAKPYLNFIIFQIEMIPFFENEKDVGTFIEAAYDLGVHVRVTDLDFDTYPTLAEYRDAFKFADSYGGDFVYSNVHNLEIGGKDNEQLRSAINRFKKSELSVNFIEPKDYSSSLMGQLNTFLDQYALQKKEDGNTTSFTYHLKSYISTFGQSDQAAMQLIKLGDTIKGFSITERVNHSNVSMPDRKVMLQDVQGMHQAFRAINYFDIQYWQNRLGAEHALFCNFGNSGDSKALYETKRRMNPCHILRVYKFKDPETLDSDLALFAKPAKKERKKLF